MSQISASSRVSVWTFFPPLLLLLGAAWAIRGVSETDVYWHILMGQDILLHLRLTGDPSWVFGPGDDTWQTTQWVSEVALYLAYDSLGWLGIVILRLLLLLGLAVSLYFAIRAAVSPSLRGSKLNMVVTLIGIPLLMASPFMAMERPQAVSLILLPWIGLYALRLLYTGQWPRWWAIGLLCVVWAWFHGAVLIVAPILAGAFFVRCTVLRVKPTIRTLREGLLVIAAVAIAPALGPLGFGYYRQAYLIQQASSEVILEWLPSKTTEIAFISWVALLALWAFGSLKSWRATAGRIPKPIVLEGVWLLLLLGLSLVAYRYIPVAILIAAPLIARRLALSLASRPVPKPLLPRWWVVALICFASALTITGAWPTLSNVNPVREGSPERAWAALRDAQGERRVLVFYNISGATLIMTRPGVSVGIDGRTDRYGDLIPKYLELASGKYGWQDTFTDYADATDALILKESALREHLIEMGWTLMCEDGDYAWLSAPGISGSCT